MKPFAILLACLAAFLFSSCKGGTGEFDGGRPADAALVATAHITGDPEVGSATVRAFTSAEPYARVLAGYEQFVVQKGGDKRLVNVGGAGERFDSSGKCVRINPWVQPLTKQNLAGKLSDAQVKRLDEAIGAFVETVPDDCKAP